jgi:exonuclease SbcC
MSYPRIYSLSTVGILKHYVHDYIFHPLRTDFIGPNGVGKSVIADLLQLLFIYDTELIQFGTDAVKNEKRSIYTLPYDVGVAYCFLNVEVNQGQFLVIGIALSAQSGTGITPFVLLKQPELHLGINELALTRLEIPWAKEFLINGTTIPDTKNLAAMLKDKGLYLKTFRKKEEVRQYYQFLFDKEVLSINLSADSNLKAFARVIQSFSKAKSLNLSPSAASRSLKEFLFENEDKELVSAYEQQQESLEKILREYGRLHKDIQTLKEKQQQLNELRTMGDALTIAEKDLLVSELSQLHQELKTIASEEKNGRSELNKLNNLRLAYEEKQLKLPRLEKALAEAVREANDQVDLHVQYEQLNEEISELDENINDLETLNPLIPNPDWANHIQPIDVNLRTVSQIKELVSFAVGLLKDFPTFDEIDTAWQKQDEAIATLTSELNVTKQANEKLIHLLEDSPDESLIHWLNGQSITLSPEQRSAVLYFASTSVKKPQDPLARERYLNTTALFDGFEISPAENGNGFWLKLGALHEFIADDPLAQSFTIATLKENRQAKNKTIATQLEEIGKFKKGQPYDEHLFSIVLTRFYGITRLLKD